MLHFIVLDTITPHVCLSFDMYCVFNYILRAIVPSVHVAFKAAISTENNETSVINRYRPYPAAVVIESKFWTLNHRIRTKKSPNTSRD